MSTETVAVGRQPARQQGAADSRAGAVGPTFGQPGEELKAPVPAIIDGIFRARLGKWIRRIREKNLFLLSQRQIGPQSADDHVGKSHQFLPGEPAEPVEPSNPVTLGVQQPSLHPNDRGVGRTISAIQQAATAAPADRWRESGDADKPR